MERIRFCLAVLFLLTMLASCKLMPKETDEEKKGEVKKTWWKEATVYQIYPRSFQDSDGDGVGDLKGIITRLDYIKSLGIDAVWLNPIYTSPNKDNGYDISDYENIQPQYGNMNDFDTLLKGFHDRGIKVMMDMVLNLSLIHI